MWFIIATVRIDHGTTQELYGPFESGDEAEIASRSFSENPRVIRQIITEPFEWVADK
jgi:hypothetical protein